MNVSEVISQAIGLPCECHELPAHEPMISAHSRLRCESWLARRQRRFAANADRALELLLDDAIRIGGAQKNRLKR